MSSEVVAGTIPSSEAAALRAHAAANDRSVSRELRRAVHFYLREHVAQEPAPAILERQ